MREYVATAKTVEEAIQLGCEALSVDRDDLGVSYEILEMPQKTGFLGLKVTPAKVKVTVETADTEPEATPAAPVAAAEPEPAPAEEAAEQPAAEDAAPAEAETPLDIAADPRLQAAVDYLTPIFHLMGVEEFTFTAGKKGEATILHVEGAHLGALIGRRGGGYRGSSSRPPRDNRGGSRNGGRGYGRPSSVPEREFASAPRDPNARPQAPARTARIHDGDDFDMFGKIEL